jgi:hypothetical protein
MTGYVGCSIYRVAHGAAAAAMSCWCPERGDPVTIPPAVGDEQHHNQHQSTSPPRQGNAASVQIRRDLSRYQRSLTARFATHGSGESPWHVAAAARDRARMSIGSPICWSWWGCVPMTAPLPSVYIAAQPDAVMTFARCRNRRRLT